jgi:hypothetical protein
MFFQWKKFLGTKKSKKKGKKREKKNPSNFSEALSLPQKKILPKKREIRKLSLTLLIKDSVLDFDSDYFFIFENFELKL